ncbi:MAG: hypothetical protein H7256_03550 [Bdellovibrio sp.]|nr:hypothetical protein [Bdellovibrio sp.]
MAVRNIVTYMSIIGMTLSFAGCISRPMRLPQSVTQVYHNSDIQQGLLMAAQNNILFSIPDSTIREVEKTEIDLKCRKIEDPFWAQQLGVYLNELKKRPELFTKFNVLEIKRGDTAQVQVQHDITDGAITVVIEFAKIESRGKVTYQTNMPCSGSMAEYIGRDLIKTDFDFPSATKLSEALQKLNDRPAVPRFQFSNLFLSYLAERGVIFKFNHELSFEKMNDKKYVMAEIMDRFAEETKEPFHKYINYWFKEISQKSAQAQLIQMFAVVADKDQKSGVWVESEGERARRVLGQTDLTYIYTSYSTTDDNQVKVGSLKELDQCLQSFTTDMSGIKFRKPASTERESFLRPGYSCTKDKPNL